MSCRRCSDCIGHDHHWLPNDDFGNDDPDESWEMEGPADVMYTCKHCPALGDECETCDGSGEVTNDGCIYVDCPKCDGVGIIERKKVQT